jgi:hypothetical protein
MNVDIEDDENSKFFIQILKSDSDDYMTSFKLS